MRILLLSLVFLIPGYLMAANPINISPQDDIVCSGLWEDQLLYVRTENADGRKNLVIFLSDNWSVKPPYAFEGKFPVTQFETMPQGHGGPSERRYLRVTARGKGPGGASYFARMVIDLLDSAYTATLIVTPPGTKIGDQELEIEANLPCQIISEGNRPVPAH